jgi:hypothetical protein
MDTSDAIPNRKLLARVTSAAGVVLALVPLEPASLLIGVAAVSICLGWPAGLVSVAVMSLLFAAMLFLLPPLLSAPVADVVEGSVRLSVFMVSAFGLWLLVQIFRSVSFFEQVYRVSQPSIEDIPGLGWSAYPDGRMRFVNPAALDFIGISAEEMKQIMERGDDSWWRLFVHRATTSTDAWSAGIIA